MAVPAFLDLGQVNLFLDICSPEVAVLQASASCDKTQTKTLCQSVRRRFIQSSGFTHLFNDMSFYYFIGQKIAFGACIIILTIID